MTTEEKIKLYEELQPGGKSFPTNKKPDERPEDMQWLDDKIQEFKALKEGANQPVEESAVPESEVVTESVTPETDPVEESAVASESITAPEIKPEVEVSEEVEVYTVDQLKCIPEPKFSEMIKLAEEGKIKVVNQL